jgi:general stress protein 26
MATGSDDTDKPKTRSTARKAATPKAAASAAPAEKVSKPRASRALTKPAASKPDAPAETKPATKAKASSTRTAAPKTAAKPATRKSPVFKPAPSEPAELSETQAETVKAAEPVANTNAAETTAPHSRDTSKTGKQHDENVERAWTLADRIGIAMFVTWDGERQRARPLAATVKKDEGTIYFLTDVSGEKDDQVKEHPFVSVNFADHRHSRYVVFSGKATVSNDRAQIKALWSPLAKAWWDSPDDPSIRVIKLTPEDAELWDSPGRAVSTLSMLTAAVTGRRPKLGDNAKIDLR